jgi:hypothetical protein
VRGPGLVVLGGREPEEEEEEEEEGNRCVCGYVSETRDEDER